MPRLTPQNREARRAEIVAAARRRFSRDGFHQTSMPAIAAEAGGSTGAPYRYFAGKDEIVLEIAGQAFRSIFDPMLVAARESGPLQFGDLVELACRQIRDAPEAEAKELFRCAVQVWGELLRRDDLRQRALSGLNEVHRELVSALHTSQEAGELADDVNPEAAARVLIALVHGLILQWVAFDLDDLEGFTGQARLLLRNSL